MRRREVIRLVGGITTLLPIAARAQQTGQLPKIGFLGPSSAATAKDRVAAFERRLGELGWVPDRTVTIRYQWADGWTAPLAVDI